MIFLKYLSIFQIKNNRIKHFEFNLSVLRKESVYIKSNEEKNKTKYQEILEDSIGMQ